MSNTFFQGREKNLGGIRPLVSFLVTGLNTVLGDVICLLGCLPDLSNDNNELSTSYAFVTSSLF